MDKGIRVYIQSQTTADKKICDLLAKTICRTLPHAENKIWHAHPVWFIDGNPVVGFGKLKNCIRLLFWSGQSFNEESLQHEGSFKAAEYRYTSVDQINIKDLKRWNKKAETIQWDYKNIVKRRGQLEPLKGLSSTKTSQKASPYGSKKFKTVEDYHASFPAGVQKKLSEIRKIIAQGAPRATEVISYNMPAFRQHGVLVYYAAYKEHIGFYPTSSPIKVFRDDLVKYKTSKGAIQFSLDKPLPKTLIKKIIKFRVKEVIEKAQKNNRKKL
jgi:uncharacterized protein YdhG (YjbR/CyaY superfamily)